MPYIIEGKKCSIWKSLSEHDRFCDMDRSGKPIERKERGKDYEVYLNIDSEKSGSFPLDTPMYEPLGWDDLEQAKIFFLLNEI